MTAPAFREWLASLADAEATVPARVVLERLPDSDAVEVPRLESTSRDVAEPTWRERLWTCPAETRLGKHELLEALGKSDSWLYHRTGPKADHRIPHRKLDGVLVFVAGEVRTWLRDSEESIHEVPMGRGSLEVVG